MKPIALLFVAITLSAVTASADPVCRPCPFDCEYLNFSRRDCSNLPEGRGLCCVDLNGRGMELLRAQDEALQGAPSYDYRRCPPGFTPSEQRCSDAERRRGCRDARQPEGHGCVSSQFR